MYPDLSYILHDLFGTQPDGWAAIVKTFGLMLAVSFLASAFVYYIELKRKASEGIFGFSEEKIIEGKGASWSETLSSAFVGLVLGGKALYARGHFEEFRADPAAVLMSSKMNWLGAVIGMAVIGGLTWWDAHRRRLPQPIERTIKIYPHDRIMELTGWAAVGGILGAKLFDIFDNWSSFVRDPWGAIASGGGLAIYGGLICGFIAVASYVVSKKIPLLHAMDACAPALVAGYGVGRIGCQLSGDGDWGVANLATKPGWLAWAPDWLWSFSYPRNVLNEGEPIAGCAFQYCAELPQPVWPTPLFETLLMVVVFVALWSLRKRLRAPGLMFFVYMMLISVERFFIEFIRVNNRYDFFGTHLSQAQMISMAVFAVGLIGSFWAVRRWRIDSAA